MAIMGAAAVGLIGSVAGSQIAAGGAKDASSQAAQGQQNYINYLQQQGFDQETINAMLMGYAKQQGSLGTAANQAAMQQIMSGMGISPYASGTTAPGPTGTNQLASGGVGSGGYVSGVSLPSQYGGSGGPSIGGVSLYPGATSSMVGQPGSFTTEGGFILPGSGNVLNASNVQGGLQGALTPVGPASITNPVAAGSFMGGPTSADVQAQINPEADWITKMIGSQFQAQGLQSGNFGGGGYATGLDSYLSNLLQSQLYDPAYQKALTNQTNEINRYFSLAGLNLPSVANNISSTTGQGNQLTSGMSNTAQNVAPGYAAIGASNAQGTLGQANAWGTGTTNITNLLQKYLQNQQQGGGSGSGGNWSSSPYYDAFNYSETNTQPMWNTYAGA